MKNKDKKSKITKLCVVCSAAFKVNQEGPSSKTLCCSSKCKSIRMQYQYEQAWLQGLLLGHTKYGILEPYVRRWMFKTYGEKCSKCGWAEKNPSNNKIPVQINHIDGDPWNTTPKNLEVLCPNCHSLTRTYGGLNIKNNHSKTRYKVLRDRGYQRPALHMNIPDKSIQIRSIIKEDEGVFWTLRDNKRKPAI